MALEAEGPRPPRGVGEDQAPRPGRPEDGAPTSGPGRAPPFPAASSGKPPTEPHYEPLEEDLPWEEPTFEADEEPTYEADRPPDDERIGDSA